MHDLHDRQAVEDACTDLFLLTDSRDWAGVEACFAPEVHFDMTSLSGGQPVTLSPQQIAAAWKQGLELLEAVHHQAGNFRITVRGGEADAFCYGIAYHYRQTASGRNTRVFVGSYEFHLRRDGERWAIDRFRFNAKFVEGNLELERG
jgi:hypothetical protein